MKRLGFAVALSLMVLNAVAVLPAEKIPNIKELPADYPDSWIFAHDGNFTGLSMGKIILFDVAADTHEYKGAVDAAQFAGFQASKRNSEIYIVETFYSRGTSGVRTDVISIYDMATLNKVDEILLPDNNRAVMVSNKYLTTLLDDDRFLVVYAFTPATSAIVIDTKKRTIVSQKGKREISLPGCTMIYPTGRRGFSSLCNDGSLFTVHLNRQGKEKSRFSGQPFFSADDDPVFDKPVYVGDMAYFISFKGLIYPVDMSGEKPKVLNSWSLTNEQQQKQNWRPSGWQIATSDRVENVYVIMDPNGFDGSHKFGGKEVWVANMKRRRIDRRIAVETNAFSIQLTSGTNPLLAVINAGLGLDVYSTEGELQRSFTLGDAATVFTLHAQR